MKKVKKRLKMSKFERLLYIFTLVMVLMTPFALVFSQATLSEINFEVEKTKKQMEKFMIDIKFIIDIVYDILIKMTLWVLIGGIPIVFMALIVVIVKKTNFGIKTRKVIAIIYQILIWK